MQFDPQPTKPPEHIPEWNAFCRPRLGKLAKVVEILYERLHALEHIPFDPSTMYAGIGELTLKVVFQEECELHTIPAIHFENHAPRPSPF